MSDRPRPALVLTTLLAIFSALAESDALGDEAPEVIPHGQRRVPGWPLPPAEAARAMTVPEGFKVELVASEPEIVNPVAMTFDERGRIWVVESVEYPRLSAGPGRDRVEVLEDTDGDGKADKFSVFAEGLNIPSGIAVGHGGVWVANSPDILLLRDTDGDGKADRREVVVTGFGRADVHELPNSLNWGPDGWLYGWNGVFNPSRVTQHGKTHEFTCAMFRIHPRTREFEVFCEGTSNPWGIAWDVEGSAFSSACVIDHLWHLTETGYYHRQAGAYPPFTWKIDSIVEHHHQQAAYCGIHLYDSDTYPAAYRGKLFMGNIHGNCLNVDRLQRKGSTYSATPEPDFLKANDDWFMPVSQKTGPDGNLYVLDWYDRYHCYQDARRDPGGIDRLKGRLYRVRYGDSPRRQGFDLSRASDDALIDLLGSGNGYDRDTARRLLSERDTLAANARLQSIALDAKTSRRTRMNALWTLISRATPDPDFHLDLLSDPDSGFRAWGVRAAGNMRRVSPLVRARVVALARDPSPDVRLQVAIAARKIEGTDPLAILTGIAAGCDSDPLLPHVVWQNLHPLLDNKDAARRFVGSYTAESLREHPPFDEFFYLAIGRILGRARPGDVPIAGLLRAIRDADPSNERYGLDAIFEVVAEKVQSGELKDSSLAFVRDQFTPLLRSILSDPDEDGRLGSAAAILATSCKVADGFALTRRLAGDPAQESSGLRLDALNALIFAGDRTALDIAARALSGPAKSRSAEFRGEVLSALGRLDDARVAALVLEHYPRLEPEIRPRAVELLTQRVVWSRALMKAVREKTVPAGDLNPNQVGRLVASKDPELVRLVKAQWGTVREGRNLQREQVIKSVRALLRKTPGDPFAGERVFQKLCAQCHKIYGRGQDVEPEITVNGRGSYEQLLSNVFDPSLVIGSAYQGTTVATHDGRVLTGLLVEKNPQRVVLKTQGGKVETVPAGNVEGLKVSELSLMPEDLEKQLDTRELADLFAFLTLDRPPGDPAAKPLPGAEEIARRPGAR